MPATSANLGAGFDCLGLALGLMNEVRVGRADGRRTTYRVHGHGAAEIETHPEHNLFDRALSGTLRSLGVRRPALSVQMVNRIPWRRGLGSSAAAAVSGVAAGVAVAGQVLDAEELVRRALPFEGHPDNIVPAAAGGFTVATMDGKSARFVRLAPPALVAVVLMPELEVATSEARRRLPERVPFGDAVHNVGRAALFAAAVAAGRLDLLDLATEDRLHQPYRAPLVPGFDRVVGAARRAGAAGAFLSGSGPTILALAERERAEPVRTAMVRAWKRHGEGAATDTVLPLARRGCRASGRLVG